MMGIRHWAGALALAAGLLIGSANAQYATPPAQPTQKAQPAQQQAAKPVYDTGYYVNRSGQKVHRPERTQGNVIPAGATAQCRDGTYSFSAHRSGTCSHHGGVEQWGPFQQPASAQPQAQNSQSFNEAVALYLEVIGGKRSLQSLTPAERHEVEYVAALMRRPTYTSQKCEDLADNQQEAVSAAADLQRCLANGDDDCDSQMQQAKDTHDDYEDALDESEDDCQ